MQNQRKSSKAEVVFVLDRSGSMENVVSDTIGGFNSMINKEKKKNPNALVYFEQYQYANNYIILYHLLF